MNSNNNNWSFFEDKLFEQALVMFPEGTSLRWEKIAERVPGKSPREVKEHYDRLLYDINEIEAGRVQIPNYPDDLASWESDNQISFASTSRSRLPGENERKKKGAPWSEQEHRLFLKGLQQYGKGDWRSIARNVVVTRTPTQVASHAQKFFLRQSAVHKERKRSSIHDINTVDSDTMEASSAEQNRVSMTDGNVEQQLPPGPGIHLPPQGLAGYQNNWVFMADGSAGQQLPLGPGRHLVASSSNSAEQQLHLGPGRHLVAEQQLHLGPGRHLVASSSNSAEQQLPLGPERHLVASSSKRRVLE